MTWTSIPDANLLPGKPGRSIDVIALRDNIQHMRAALITTSGTFTPLPGITDYLVIVCGASGGSGYSTSSANYGSRGGDGVAAAIIVTGITAPQTITLGAGGTAGASPSTNGTAGGTTTAFGVSITGGAAGANGSLVSGIRAAHGIATGGKTIISAGTPGGLETKSGGGSAQNGQSGWVLVLW